MSWFSRCCRLLARFAPRLLDYLLTGVPRFSSGSGLVAIFPLSGQVLALCSLPRRNPDRHSPSSSTGRSKLPPQKVDIRKLLHFLRVGAARDLFVIEEHPFFLHLGFVRAGCEVCVGRGEGGLCLSWVGGFGG